MKSVIRYAIFSLIALSLASCATSHTNIATWRQPDVRVDDEIVRIATVDRSEPASQAVSALEGLVTGEHIGQDAMARKTVFSSLNIIMSEQDRFELILTSMSLPGSKGGNKMKEPLSMKLIQGIATKYDADAILVLESFDSDTRNVATDLLEWGSITQTGIDPINYPNNVRTGWRLYDARDGRVIDEFHSFIAADGWWAFANHPAYIDRQEVESAADASAYQMAGRIVPVEVFFERLYYRNSGLGNKQLKKADDFAKAGRLERAAEIWHDVYLSAEKDKVRGRAAYNLAVWSESVRDLPAAIGWIEKSIELGNKRAIDYSAVLTHQLELENRTD